MTSNTNTDSDNTRHECGLSTQAVAWAQKQPWQMTLDERRPIESFQPIAETEPGRGPTFDISLNTRRAREEMEGIKGASVLIPSRGQTLIVFDRSWTTADARAALDEIQTYVEGRDWEPHRLAVEQAIRKGWPVPAEVLADYPDLAQQATSKLGLPSGSTAIDSARA